MFRTVAFLLEVQLTTALIGQNEVVHDPHHVLKPVGTQCSVLTTRLVAACSEESRGHCSQLTKKLASIGSRGRHPQNAERDLFRVLQLPLEPLPDSNLLFSVLCQ